LWAGWVRGGSDHVVWRHSCLSCLSPAHTYTHTHTRTRTHTHTHTHTHPHTRTCTRLQKSAAPELSEEKRRKQEKPLDFLVQQAAVDHATKWRRVFQLGRWVALCGVCVCVCLRVS
jgi:hypothetical protein